MGSTELEELERELESLAIGDKGNLRPVFSNEIQTARYLTLR